MILPVFLFTVTSATIAGKELAKPPIATPRPLTTLPLPSFDAATFGFQFAAFATASSTPIQRALPFVWVASMFWIRNAIGSMPAVVRERVDHLLGGEQRLRRARRAEPDALEEAVVAVDDACS